MLIVLFLARKKNTARLARHKMIPIRINHQYRLKADRFGGGASMDTAEEGGGGGTGAPGGGSEGTGVGAASAAAGIESPQLGQNFASLRMGFPQ